MTFNRLTIIGLGLIGSSIARAARERKLAGEIIGYDTNEISLAYGRKHNIIDKAADDLLTAAAKSDLIIIATPPSTLAAVAEAIAPSLKPGAVVMDTCSVKQAAIDAIAPHIPPGVEFIPAHPIAGSEHGGISAGRADLFDRKLVLITPAEPQLTKNLQDVTTFWQGMGARVEAMPPYLHDQIYAHVSHLPHLLAFAAAQSLSEVKNDDTLQPFLRLAGSNLSLWAEIFLLNKANVLKALDRYLDVVLHIGGELSQAPTDSPSENDERLARTALFPRIAASCLITTVMEAEKQAGIPFAHYAGPGFTDFTSPAAIPPDEDIEKISGQYQAVKRVIEEYVQRLKAMRAAIASENTDKIISAI